MSPATLSALLECHAASDAIKRAHDALVKDGLTASAQLLHQAGQQVFTALGLLVRAEAERRVAAEAVQP